MAQSWSDLVTYERYVSNNSGQRTHKIDKITIHHMAGNLSVEQCGEVLQNRGVSANYGVNGKEVGIYCNEEYRTWASASPENDQRAVTIEVANDGGAPNWHVSDESIETLIELCVDICRRNDMPGLVYDGTINGTLTRHDMFVATCCPGPYLGSKFPYIASEVNRRLGHEQHTPTPGSKSIDELANEVIAGVYGNGDERKARLGSLYDQVQARVNEILLCGPIQKSIDEVAQEVIAGEWGNGQERINRLCSAGYDYNAVQGRVNSLLL